MKIKSILCLSLLIPAVSSFALRPDDTMCELLAKAALVPLSDPTPEFSWSFAAPEKKHGVQTAYQIQVVSSTELFKLDQSDLWDSGRVESDQSLFF